MTDQLIDVEGRRLAIRVTGHETPPVVMISSSGGGHEQWEPLRERLGAAMCVSYGRPGIAGSDPLPPSEAVVERPASWAANQLRALLRAARIDPPYVLASCSVGGYIADRFAAAWPDEVAGLVQIDPTYIVPIPRLSRDKPIDDADGAGILFSWDLCRTELEAAPPQRPRRAVVVSRAFGTLPAEVVARAWQPLTVAEADQGWRETQKEWAQRLGAIHVAADSAGHHVHLDAPELVELVLRAVLAAARAETGAILDPEDVSVAGGQILTLS